MSKSFTYQALLHGLVHLRVNVRGTGVHLWALGGGFCWRLHFPGAQQYIGHLEFGYLDCRDSAIPLKLYFI